MTMVFFPLSKRISRNYLILNNFPVSFWSSETPEKGLFETIKKFCGKKLFINLGECVTPSVEIARLNLTWKPVTFALVSCSEDYIL